MYTKRGEKKTFVSFALKARIVKVIRPQSHESVSQEIVIIA